MADIGKISVTFSANASGFIKGATESISALEKFAKQSEESGRALSGAFTADFGDRLQDIGTKLKEGSLTAEAFGAALEAAFTRASKAVETDLASSIEVLTRGLEVGTVTAEEFGTTLAEMGERATDSINSTLEQSISSAAEALKEGKISAEEYAEAVAHVAATAAGSGLDEVTTEVSALSKALSIGAISAEDFLESQESIQKAARESSLERQAESVAALREQLDAGTITADTFVESLRTVTTAFRTEAIGEYQNQIAALSNQYDDGKISVDQYHDQTEKLYAILQSTVLDDLKKQLNDLPNAYEAAGRSAEELADAQRTVQEQVDATEAALERTRASNTAGAGGHAGGGGGGGHGGGGGGGHGGGGILGGMERIGEVAAIVPGPIGEIGDIMERMGHIAQGVTGAIQAFLPGFAGISVTAGLVAGGVVAVTGAVMALVTQFGAAARETQRLATQFDASTMEIGVLQGALRESGVSMGEFDHAARGIGISLTRASDGSKAFTSAFRQIGLSVDDLQGKGADEQFRMIVESLSHVEDSSRRSALAIQLLGREGATTMAKMGQDAHKVAERFEEAEQAQQRFKTGFSEFNADQLVEATNKIGRIGEAAEGVGLVIAEAFAPLAGSIGSALADIFGTISNVLAGFIPIVQLIGAAIGGVLEVAGRLLVTLGRWVAAIFDVLNTVLNLESAVAAVQGFFSGILTMLDQAGSSMEWAANMFKSWWTGVPVERLEEAKREAAEIAELTRKAADYEEKYGDKTDEIKKKMADVQKMMKTKGANGEPLVSKDVGEAAIKDLKEQLKSASPHAKEVTKATEDMKSAMERAADAEKGIGNNLSKDALTKYKKDYEKLLKDLENKKISPETFNDSVKGLGDKFNAEMDKIKPIKALQDQIKELATKYREKMEGPGGSIKRDFKKFDETMAASPSDLPGADLADARLQRIDEEISKLGLDAETDAFGKYREQMEVLNAVTVRSAEEEKKLQAAREKAAKDLMKTLPGAKKDTESDKFLKDMSDLDKAKQEILNGPNPFSSENQKNLQEIDDRKKRVQSEYAGRGPESETMSAIREFDTQMKEFDEAMKKTAPGSAERDAIMQKRENVRQNFVQTKGEDLMDQVVKGGQPDRRAASAVSAGSQEGVSTYLRIMRGSDSVTAKQLREARESKLLLMKIKDNTASNGLTAAGI